MGVLDNALMFGLETVYGTADTLTTAYEVAEDEFEDDRPPLESVGMRAGAHTLRADRSRIMNHGGTGAVALDVLDRGMLPLLRSMFPVVTGPAQVGGGTVYETTFATSKDGPDLSATIQLLRSTMETGTEDFTYLGATCTAWELTAEPEAYLKLKVSYDYQDARTDVAGGTPDALYPAGALLFDWSQVQATIDGSPVALTKFSLTANQGLKTDRRLLRGTQLKKFPRRKETPTYEGELGFEFESLTDYTRFTSGAVVPLVFTATGTEIEPGTAYSLTFTLPAVQYRGSTPKASVDELTMQACPFRVLHDGTTPAISAEVVSTDTVIAGL